MIVKIQEAHYIGYRIGLRFNTVKSGRLTYPIFCHLSSLAKSCEWTSSGASGNQHRVIGVLDPRPKICKKKTNIKFI